MAGQEVDSSDPIAIAAKKAALTAQGYPSPGANDGAAPPMSAPTTTSTAVPEATSLPSFSVPPILKNASADPDALASTKVVASQANPDGSSTHVVHVPSAISAAVKSKSTAMKVASPQAESANPPNVGPLTDSQQRTRAEQDLSPDALGQSGQSGAGADGTTNGTSNQDVVAGRAPRPTSEAMSSVPADNGLVTDLAKQNPTATPELKPQGGKNAFTRWLSRFTGVSGPTPNPGEPYTGPTTPQEKAVSEATSPFAKVLHVAGRVGNAMAAAGGTPEERQIAEQRAEFGPKTQLEIAALNNEQAYRKKMLQNTANRNQTLEEKNAIQQQKNDAIMRTKGYVTDPNGGYRAMNEDEILQDPQLSQNTQLRSAAIMSKQAQQELAKAHADAIMNPQNPTFQQKEREIQSRLAMAQAHLAVARGNLELNAQRTGMEAQRNQWEFGRNPLTGEDLTTQNAPPGMLADASGAPVPTRMQTMFGPTGQQKSSAGRAKQMVDAIPNVINQINSLKDELGPVMGRWNDFRQGKVGMDDPAFASLNMNLELVASGVTLAHSMGRMPTVLFDAFNQRINAPQQTPENLVSTLQSALPYLKAIQNIGTPQSVGKTSPTPKTPIHSAAAAKSESDIPSVDEWKAKRAAAAGGR